MRGSVAEYSSIVGEGLNAQELAALQSASPCARGRTLDIGVGAGRTVQPLQEISADYVGVDYVQEMIDHCKKQYPDVRFERADARSMSQFSDGSFDLVFFSCNGISMVDHEGRLAILREAYRLLSASGAFIFSTCNLNSPQFEAVFRFPAFQRTPNLAKLMVRSGRFVALTAFRLFNRLRYKKNEVREGHYAIVNDVCHHYRTMLYFTTVENQIRQLESVGFNSDVGVYDLAGRRAPTTVRDGTVAFVARK